MKDLTAQKLTLQALTVQIFVNPASFSPIIGTDFRASVKSFTSHIAEFTQEAIALKAPFIASPIRGHIFPKAIHIFSARVPNIVFVLFAKSPIILPIEDNLSHNTFNNVIKITSVDLAMKVHTDTNDSPNPFIYSVALTTNAAIYCHTKYIPIVKVLNHMVMSQSINDTFQAISPVALNKGFNIVSFNIVPVGSNAARHLLLIIVA